MSKIKLFLIFLLSTLIAYGSAIRYGFSQDDFYFLALSKANSLTNVLNFFSPASQAGFAFFRPLGTQLYYFIFTSIFGLARAPLFMHIFMLIIQTINAYLVSLLVTSLTRDKKLAFMIGLLYAVSSVHFLSLFYIAATQQLLAATFSLLSLNAFLNKRFGSAGLYFGLGLLSKETALVTPVIAFILLLLNSKFEFKKFIPYLITGIGYVFLRLTSHLTIQSEYHFIFSPSVLTTIRWYWLFAYGAPEQLLSYGLPHFGINFAQFIRDFGVPAIITIFGSVGLGILAFISMLRKRYFLYFLWFIVSIFLVMWFPDHRYPHYLDLGLVPLLLILLLPLRAQLRYLITTILVIVSLTSIYLSVISHWTIKRAILANVETQTIINSGQCHASAGISFTGDPTEVREISYALGLANGPRIICNNPDLPVYYEGLYP